MKKSFSILSLGLLLGLSLNSCSNEELAPNSDELVEIKLTSDVLGTTRGTNLTEQATAITAGHQVGITITGASSTHQNQPWSVAADGTLSRVNEGSPIYYNGTQSITIKAYHPYNPANKAWDNFASGTSYQFDVKTDQSGTGYADSDLLYAEQTASKQNTAVNLTFRHLMAKINITVVNNDGQDMSDADIYITNTYTRSTFMSGAASSNPVETSKTDIYAGKGNAETDNKYGRVTAIIVPQTINANTKLIKVVWNGKVYDYKLSSDQTFVAGRVYTFGLKIKNATEMTLGLASVTDWSIGNLADDNGFGDMKEMVTTGTHSGHNWVNFDLPSGKLWATTNIGATNNYDSGKYYAWGETKGNAESITAYPSDWTGSTNSTYSALSKKTTFSWDNYKWGNSQNNIFSTTFYDAAQANWGGNWQTPSPADWTELKNNCYLVWTSFDANFGGNWGVIIFKAKKGEDKGKFDIITTMDSSYSLASDLYIFLPAAGYFGSSTSVQDNNHIGHYWSNEIYVYNKIWLGAACTFSQNNGLNPSGQNDRYKGLPVRAVCTLEE